MNILHMKYAVEVARLGSLKKASEALMIAQPNISRSIKELEAELGVTIFDRNARGMFLTPEGEEFVEEAKGILKQIEYVENLYKSGALKKQRFSIAVPKAGYLSYVFAQFSKYLEKEAAEFFYEETDAQTVIHNVLNQGYRLGILRYADMHDTQVKTMLEEKGLNYELIVEFSQRLLMREDSPLAAKTDICYEDLSEYIEVTHTDPYMPALPLAKVGKEEFLQNVKRRFFVYERAAQLELLSQNPNTFAWSSPLTDTELSRYHLLQRDCAENKKIYKDILIYKKGYKLTELDNCFITELCNAKRKFF